MPDATATATVVTPLKPSWQTGEFWLHVLAQLVISAIGIFTAMGGPLDALATALAGASPVLAAIVPLAKAAILSFTAWASLKLSSSYTDVRTDAKVQVAQIQANTAAQVQLPTGMTSGQASALLAQLGQAAK